jgi:hypothetical protein
MGATAALFFIGEVPKAREEPKVRPTLCWREMDSNFWYRGTKAVDFRSIPGIVGVSARLLNDTT